MPTSLCLGVGNLNPAQSGFVKGGFLSVEELAELSGGGAVGDMAGHIFTIDGCLYDKQYDDRIIGVTLDDLKHIAKTIVVAAGPEKTEAILGALRTGAVTVLVTDDRTASSMLAARKLLVAENTNDQ